MKEPGERHRGEREGGEWRGNRSVIDASRHAKKTLIQDAQNNSLVIIDVPSKRKQEG